MKDNIIAGLPICPNFLVNNNTVKITLLNYS